jgi:2-C-methyl-D-erythritol 4-phosphate cytidylyltransferase/2-C-methyl-D-erythritol 2,4-cyclodiphosphate synthase
MSGERRAGVGYDAHRFGDAGRRLVLGGVEVEGETGLAGHSDADVVSHALTDALLGAAGLGDIGDHFPDDDPRWADADSVALLAQVGALLAEAGWRAVNADLTVIAERPRLGTLKQAMAQRLAGALGVPPASVNVKATTNEGMGFIGRAEGIAALAVVQIERDARRGDG